MWHSAHTDYCKRRARLAEMAKSKAFRHNFPARTVFVTSR